MEGICERDRRAMERIVLQAWWNSNLDGAGEKLRRPSYYLDQLKPKKPQTADDVLTVFREHQARGAKVSIRHIGPDGKELN
jgi:hypothetical protein